MVNHGKRADELHTKAVERISDADERKTAKKDDEAIQALTNAFHRYDEGPEKC